MYEMVRFDFLIGKELDVYLMEVIQMVQKHFYAKKEM